MKKILRIPLLLVALFLSSIPIYAHDFEVDGIYYSITSSTDKTVGVTFRGSYYRQYSNEYSGSVTIPSSVTYSGTTYSVTEIGSSAFRDCTDLTSVTIPNSVTTIGDSAFYDCTGLTSVNIPNSVTTIGSSAFIGCTGLTSVTIPNSVTKIGESAFDGCTGLTEVNITDLSAWCKINFEIVNSNPLYYAHHLKLNGSEITNLVIPEGITEINSCAFSGCSSLTSVTIPNSVTTIGGHAFRDCTHLTSITIPNSVTKIGEQAFCDCTNLTSVSIPNSVTTIEGSAFSGCTGLTSVTIPNSVTTIGDYAFYGCTNLTELIIADGTETLSLGYNGSSKGLFSDSPLVKLYLGRNLSYDTDNGYSPFYNKTTLKEVTIGNLVSSIGNYAFYCCTGLTEVTIPNSVTTIGAHAFDGTGWYNNQCDGILYLDNCCIGYKGEKPTGALTFKEDTRMILTYAFYDCTGLTSVNIPNSVTEIGALAFYGCTGLTEVNITDLSVWCKIDFAYSYSNPLYYAHHLKLNGSEITNLVIPEGITEINSNAFYGCTGLTSVTIPNSVTTIGYDAFYDCTGLTSVNIPNSVTEIGNNAFYGCNKLIDCSIKETTQTTATFYLTTPTQYNLAVNNTPAENGIVIVTDLTPNKTYNGWHYMLKLIINGNYCDIKYMNGFSTKSFSVNLTAITNATSLSAHGTYTDGDVTILGEGINYNENVTNYDGKNSITLNNLDPNTSYEIHYAVKIKEGGIYTTSESFTTGDLTWDNGGFIATSTTSARLSVETNCDGTVTGFEWKRYDAPESLAPNKAPCPVIDGMLLGSLRNLNPNVYYKCRPYYTSSSGSTYYGDWITFFTGDANVYFEPEVRTFNNHSIDNNSVTINGYALAGTDDISEQGFEYWKTGSTISPSSTDSHMTVKASGISMTATISDLEYSTTYRYRAYAKTAQGTFYGEEEEFSTGENPAGIGYIEIDGNNGIDVKLRENPVSSTAWVKVVGTSATEIEYYILSTGGVMVDNGLIPVDGDYYPIELNIYPGMYFIIVTDGSQRKTQRLIVR